MTDFQKVSKEIQTNCADCMGLWLYNSIHVLFMLLKHVFCDSAFMQMYAYWLSADVSPLAC